MRGGHAFSQEERAGVIVSSNANAFLSALPVNLPHLPGPGSEHNGVHTGWNLRWELFASKGECFLSFVGYSKTHSFLREQRLLLLL